MLVVEFHTKGGPFRFTAQDHTELVDAFYRIAQDRENKIVILTGVGGEFIPKKIRAERAAPWPRSDVNDKKVPDRVGSVVFVIQKCSPVGDSLGRICRSCHYVLSRSVRLAVILGATTPRATSRTCSRNQACEASFVSRGDSP